MPRILASLTILALLAMAAAPVARAQMQPQTQGDVTYISGGIGDEWQQSMEALRNQYNLHLLFAQQGTGAYFANIPVQITDGSGHKVLDAVSQGPFLYARLRPGQYTVTASYLGQAQSRAAQIPATGGIDLNFFWAGGTNY